MKVCVNIANNDTTQASFPAVYPVIVLKWFSIGVLKWLHCGDTSSQWRCNFEQPGVLKPLNRLS